MTTKILLLLSLFIIVAPLLSIGVGKITYSMLSTEPIPWYEIKAICQIDKPDVNTDGLAKVAGIMITTLLLMIFGQILTEWYSYQKKHT